MAVTLTGSNGLFTRLGAIFYIGSIAKTHGETVETEAANAIGKFNQTDLPFANALTNGEGSLTRAAGSAFPILGQAASGTIIGMVNDDTPLPTLTLDDALTELAAQMTAASATINGVNPSVVTTPNGSNTGTGTFVLSTGNAKGVEFQYLRAETIYAEVTTDSQEGAVTAGREILRVRGESAVRDVASIEWPGGSGTDFSIRVTDPSEDAGSTPGRNILTNSDFADFTANDPDNWTIGTGAAGTDILEESTVVHRGTSSLEIVGDGSTLVSLSQAFNTAGATVARLKPNTRYVCSFFLRVDSAVLDGVLRVAVKDGSNTILDSAAAAESTTLSGLVDDTWTHKTFDFVTPLSLPAGAKCVIELTTAVTNTASVFVDSLVLAEGVTFTEEGLFGIVVAGETDFVREDSFEIAVTADLAGAGFQYWLERLIGISRYSAVLPINTAGGETIADSLITGAP